MLLSAWGSAGIIIWGPTYTLSEHMLHRRGLRSSRITRIVTTVARLFDIHSECCSNVPWMFLMVYAICSCTCCTMAEPAAVRPEMAMVPTTCTKGERWMSNAESFECRMENGECWMLNHEYTMLNHLKVECWMLNVQTIESWLTNLDSSITFFIISIVRHTEPMWDKVEGIFTMKSYMLRWYGMPCGT